MLRSLPICLALVLMAPSVLASARRRAGMLDYLFEAQRQAVEDPAPKKLLWCTGRAGKTTAYLTDCLADGLRHELHRYIYVAKTLESAMEIAWPVAKELQRDCGLDLEFSESRNRITINSTGSWLKIYGADRPGWMDKLYGQKWRRLGIDEAGFYSIDIRAFVEDIVEMRGIDQGGQLYLMSIPGRLPTGYFHEIIKGFDRFERRAGVPSPTEPDWSVHSWSWKDNPAVKDKIATYVENKIKQNPKWATSADYLRNYKGETVLERGERVYSYSERQQTYRGDRIGEDGTWEVRPDDHYVLGLDFGWDDHWAFSLVCYSDSMPELVEVESHSEGELMMDKAAAIVRGYIAAYPDLDIVGDPAWKAYFEEFRRRFDLPIMPAEKAGKWDWIEVVNADLDQGRIKIVDTSTSPHVVEMTTLTWKTMRTGRKVEMPGKKNDCCDAFLYAFRHSYHYRYEDVGAEPDPGTKEWHDREEKDLIAKLIEQDEELEEPWYGK